MADLTPETLKQLLHDRKKEDLAKLGGVRGVADTLKTDLAKGMALAEVPLKLEKFGKNKLPDPPTQSLIGLIIDGLQDKTLIMLIISAIVSLVLGVYEDPQSGWIEGTAILGAVVIVVMVSSLNDYSKERQFRKLNERKNNKPVKVIRNGETVLVSVYDVVVGDLVVIETGDIICADGLFVDGFNMKCDESTMTGESDAIKKTLEEPFMLASCQVIEGVGHMIICCVGKNSISGETLSLLQKEAEETPLQIKLESLADAIAKFGLAAAALILVSLVIKLGVSVYLGWEPLVPEKLFGTILKYVISSITVVVVAVPEGLPLAVTIALAYSMTKMLKDNNLVRHLEACETMGGATTICSDKTGTLTTNRMTVMKGYITGQLYEKIEDMKARPLAGNVAELMFTGIAVNSVAQKVAKEEGKGKPEFMGSKTECALLQFAEDNGADYVKLRAANKPVKIIPFASARKRSSAVIRVRDEFYMFTTGASEIVLSFCDKIVNPDGSVRQLMPEDKKKIEEMINTFAEQSLRTICLSYKRVPANAAPNDWDEKDENGLACFGLVGIEDPVRKEVPPAVLQCQGAGIIVRMVTGDNVVTAKAIAKKCGILPEKGEDPTMRVIEGPEFRKLEESERVKIANSVRVMARSSPTDKFMMIQALKKWGHVVAVTGDGTNDAPALKEAHVGFAMGITGTEVSKEASDIILMDDNFTSIVKAVSWGRNVYDSIRKFLQFQMTVNFVAVLLAFIGAITSSHGEAPLKPVQLLWVNLIMDTMAALALATDEPTPEMLTRKPYGKNDRLVTGRMMLTIAGQAIFQLIVNLAVLYEGHHIFGVEKDSIEHLTVVFNMFVLCQLFNELNARTLYGELNIFRGFFNNTIFVSILFFTAGMQYLIIQYGGDFASTRPLTQRQWGLCFGIAALGLPWGFILKLMPVKAEKTTEIIAPTESTAAAKSGFAKFRQAAGKASAVAVIKSAALASSIRRVHKLKTSGFGTRTQAAATYYSVAGAGGKKAD